MALSSVIPLLLGATLSGLAYATGAEEVTGPAGTTPIELEQFVRKLQAAVATQRPEAVAGFVNFPLRVNQSNRKPKYITKAQFTAEFSTVFTPKVVAAVASQDPKALFQNYQGAMFGNGEVWVSSICANSACTSSSLFVVSVNLPAK